MCHVKLWHVLSMIRWVVFFRCFFIYVVRNVKKDSSGRFWLQDTREVFGKLVTGRNWPHVALRLSSSQGFSNNLDNLPSSNHSIRLQMIRSPLSIRLQQQYVLWLPHHIIYLLSCHPFIRTYNHTVSILHQLTITRTIGWIYLQIKNIMETTTPMEYKSERHTITHTHTCWIST